MIDKIGKKLPSFTKLEWDYNDDKKATRNFFLVKHSLQKLQNLLLENKKMHFPRMSILRYFRTHKKCC